MLTDEHEHAMKVWREACGAYDDNSHDLTLSIRERTIAGDQAAAAVIAADRAGLVAENARLREALRTLSKIDDWIAGEPAEADEVVEYVEEVARAALKDTRHDADA